MGRDGAPASPPPAPPLPPGPEEVGLGKQPPMSVCGEEMLGPQAGVPTASAPSPTQRGQAAAHPRAHLLAQEQPPGGAGVGEAHAARGHKQLGGDPLVPHELRKAWRMEGPKGIRRGAAQAGMMRARGEKTLGPLGPHVAQLSPPPPPPSPRSAPSLASVSSLQCSLLSLPCVGPP